MDPNQQVVQSTYNARPPDTLLTLADVHSPKQTPHPLHFEYPNTTAHLQNPE